MIHEATINSISDLISALAELANKIETGEIVWFRGHANKDFKLLPSIARYPKGLEREALLIKRFKQNAYSFRTLPPQTEWEWLFLMQHFGVPTRLLDWTESPLVGLYFAVHDRSEHDSADGHLWAVLPAKFNYDLPRIRPTVPIDIPSFGVEKTLDDYRPDTMSMDTASSKYPVAAIAHRQNERIMAQLGVFTIMHRDTTPLEALADKHLARFTIPAASKPRLRLELLNLRITRMTMFPELASVAAVANEVLT
ncbi:MULTISPECIES: FRG domain-containing protein [unclassified Corallococcus]|uniref:FRG domain-containing protein n=1 Tax=unclassified Corallococcus TaxID=2685029 RepID=UPI001A8F1365|nr:MULTISPECIES: FRG domain-containing protein [unclassified Corallococcus]MBN9687672.1 FRG domain-containing protein [Corallococcus sp. NCSPR001]WAS88510.1 FRG domain-containing protein [Corallococcus sp. NCRR]